MEPEKEFEQRKVKRWLIVGTLSLASLLAMGAYSMYSYVGDARGVEYAAAASYDPYASLSLEAKSAYVLDLSMNSVAYEKNADMQLPLASLTKVPLVLAVSEVLSVDELVQVSRGAVERGEGGGLGTGDTWRVGDLIDFTLTASSNAGAEVLAESADTRLRAIYPDAPIGGAAVWRMNKLADELGLTETYFLNPSGLDMSETQPGAMGSAREFSVFLAGALKKLDLFDGTARTDPYLGPLNGDKKGTENTNDAIPAIPGLLIGKTGYTDLAGGNLAIVFEPEIGKRYVAVVMGSSYEGRFRDMEALLEAVRVGSKAR
ncbi:D-alanyl-D-alanine carboxypeptidase [Candidatus Kaiserbacteria bacterium]|nr:D-alanyl-D-alanine carboxypeptidase [Candidatus Kaiserbacteria bacterium]